MEHQCIVTIINESDIQMVYSDSHFMLGGLQNNYEWPGVIHGNGDHQEIRTCEEVAQDDQNMGCSGYVKYTMEGQEITIAFENALGGNNKLGVGNTGGDVWQNMSHHDYNPFNVDMDIGNRDISFRCQCTGGDINNCTVRIQAVLEPAAAPKHV